MVSRLIAKNVGSGLRAPALLLTAALASFSLPAAAQTQPQARPQAATQAQAVIPDTQTMIKLIWSIMAAVDHANATGNYSVLRDLGAPSFQANNNAASLAGIFQNIRNQRIDLSSTLLSVPNYDIPPTIVEGGLLRVRGVFPMRPSAIAFDLLFQAASGRWALFGIAVAPVNVPSPSTPNRR